MSGHLSPTIIEIDTQTKTQVENLARITGKSEKIVMREALATGLKYYKPAANAAKALVELAQWAKENNVTGPSDLSTNHDKYAWGE